ncbi:MAG: hypothetical protein JXA44_13785 [Methanospirillaceae archaeon]|nr:hypothetical protein [Methanospirillaceae archaeon]
MKHKILMPLCICILFLISPVAADWEVTITATNQMHPVTFGYSETPHNDWIENPPVLNQVYLALENLYLREIKDTDLTWNLLVSIPQGIAESTLSWDAAAIPGTLTMSGGGFVIDMKSQSSLPLTTGSYTYTITASVGPTPTTVPPTTSPTTVPPTTVPPTTVPTTAPTTSPTTVPPTTAPPGPDFTLELYPGWNMISFPQPLVAGKNTASYLNAYVNPASHSMWRYNAQTGRYEQMLAESPLTPLEGYWLYSAGVTSVPLYFASGSTIAAKNLYYGWNMVGLAGTTSKTAEIMLGSITGSWDYIFGFNGQTQTYQDQVFPPGSSATITAGSGYWLYVHENCILSD